MEPSSQTNSGSFDRSILESQIREAFGRVVYSHKTHEKCADILLQNLSVIKLMQIVLSALTTSGFIAAILGAGKWGVIAGLAISSVLLILNTYTKNFDLGEDAQKHRNTASDLWLIREKYTSLITDLIIGNKAIEMAQADRDILNEELHVIYSAAPSTTTKAYRKAQKALQYEEDMTFNDDEIDALLPDKLKMATRS